MEPPVNPRRVLVIHVTRIGDTVMTTPVLRAISETWPQAAITFLGHPKRTEVIKHLPFVNEVGGITKHSAQVRGRFLGRKQWDLAFVFGFDAPLVKFALRTSHQVLAFHQESADLNMRLWQTMPIAPINTMHAVDRLLQLAEIAGIRPTSRALAYQVTADESSAAEQRLQACGIAHGAQPIVGLVIESFPTKPYRDWDIAHFAQLCQQVANKYSAAQFVLLGGKIHGDKIARLQSALGGKLTILAGALSLRETAAVMAQCDLYVGVDTGPTQIAGALRIPMVGLYHCKHPGRVYAPLDNPYARVIDHPHRDTMHCTEQSSMSSISVDEVYAAACSHLELQLDNPHPTP